MVARDQKRLADEIDQFVDTLLDIAQRGAPGEVCEDCLEAIYQEGSIVDDLRFAKVSKRAVLTAILPGTHAIDEFQVAHDTLVAAGHYLPASWLYLGFTAMAREYVKQRKQSDAKASEG